MTTPPRIEEKTLSASDLDVLLPQNTTPAAFTTQWGRITEVGPLRVKIDGPAEDEDAAVHSTLDDTVTVGERVLCLLSGTQLIILGRVTDDDVDTAFRRSSSSPAMAMEIPPTSDLNDYLTPGWYTQDANVEAAAGLHYPAPYAGILEVFANTKMIPRSYEEVGRNYARDPRATSWIANGGLGWGNGRGFAGTGTYALLAGQTDGPVLSDGTTKLATYARKTWATVGSGTLSAMGFENTKAGVLAYPVVPLDPFAISSFVRCSVDYGDGTAAGARIWVRFYDAAGATISGGAVAPWTILPAGVWTRLELQAVAPAGSAYMLVITDIEGEWPTVGMTFDGTGLLVEKEAELEDYYDGSYALSSEVPASWTGTVNNSESILQVVDAVQGGMIWQRYWPYGVQGNRFYSRTYYSNTWYPSATTWHVYEPTNAALVQDLTSYTAGTGWTITYSELIKSRGMVRYAVRAVRTTAYTVPADGNITNTLVCTITDVASRPPWYIALSSGSTGALAAMYVNPDGTVNMSSVAPGVSMGIGAEFTGTGVWFT